MDAGHVFFLRRGNSSIKNYLTLIHSRNGGASKMRLSLATPLSQSGRQGAVALFAATLMLGALALPEARAQTAGQIVPETFRPSVTPVPGGLAIPSIPQLEAPPGSENLTVRLADIKVEGGLTQLEAETARARRQSS